MAEWFPMFRAGGMVAAEQEFNKRYKAKTGMDAPVEHAADQPGDVLPKAAVLEDFMRKNGGPTAWQAFITGMQRPVQIANAGADRALAYGTGIDQGATDEQLRKYNQAVHNLSPGMHTLGMGVGALGAGVGAAVGGIKTLAGGMKWGATKGVIGEGVAPIVLREGHIPRIAAYLANAGKATTAAHPLGVGSVMATAALASGAGANALGVGEYPQAPAQAAPAAAPASWQSPEYMAANPAFAKSWDAYQKSQRGEGPQLSEKEWARPSAVAFRNIYNSDGTLKAGVTPEQEMATRGWAAYEAKGLAGDTYEGGVDTRMFDPTAFVNNPATVRAAGGRTPEAIAQTPPMPPGALADAMDAYEVEYPDNKGGNKSDGEYKMMKALTKADRQAGQDAQFVRQGKLVGIDDPQTAIELGRSGVFTFGMLENNIQQQQGRTYTKLDPKAEVYARRQAAIDARAAEVLNIPEGPERQAAALEVSRAQAMLDQMIMTPGAYIGTGMSNSGNDN